MTALDKMTDAPPMAWSRVDARQAASSPRTIIPQSKKYASARDRSPFTECSKGNVSSFRSHAVRVRNLAASSAASWYSACPVRSWKKSNALTA